MKVAYFICESNCLFCYFFASKPMKTDNDRVNRFYVYVMFFYLTCDLKKCHSAIKTITIGWGLPARDL